MKYMSFGSAGGLSNSSHRNRRRGSVDEYASLRLYFDSASPAATIFGTCAGGVVTGSLSVNGVGGSSCAGTALNRGSTVYVRSIVSGNARRVAVPARRCVLRVDRIEKHEAREGALCALQCLE